MLSLTSTTPTMNDKNGNASYSTLRKRKRQKRSAKGSKKFTYLGSNDLTMKFENIKDPIYLLFDCLDNKSVPQLMKEFVKDSFFEVTNFVSKVIR